VTPEELFEKDPAKPWWIHGRDIGVDEDGGFWVRSDADLREDLGSLKLLGRQVIALSAREYSVLTSDKKTGLNPRHRTEPVWKYITELETGSIGSEWIAVD
jgi:hypothetical protein